MPGFTGWPADATAFLAEIAADNTREFWDRHRHRHATAVLAPMRALAAELEPEFGPLRVLRPTVNRRFRPDVPPYRTDTGGVATSAGGCTLAVVLSATHLQATAGHRAFDTGQLRRYRAAVDGPAGADLAAVLDALVGLTPERSRLLAGPPRGFGSDHPRLALLRHRGLQVGVSWPVGEWTGTPEPLHRVRGAWRAAAPVVAWLDEHVGPPDPVAPRPRPPAVDPAPVAP